VPSAQHGDCSGLHRQQLRRFAARLQRITKRIISTQVTPLPIHHLKEQQRLAAVVLCIPTIW